MNALSTYVGDYRISRTRDGLRIDVLDYHAGPLTLTRELLEDLGYVAAPPTARRAPRRGAWRELRDQHAEL